MYFRFAASFALFGVLAMALVEVGVAADTTGQEGYPDAPIRIIVGVTPGGAADLVARTVASELTNELHQTVYVENRPGATGAIACSLVVRSPHDGYTLLLASTATHGNGVYFSHEHSYDPFKDFVSIGGVAEFPLILGVNAKLPVKSVKDLIELARRKKGQLSFASAGPGSTPHLAGELFEIETNVKMLHVPYKGSGPAAADLAGGQVDMMFDGVPSLLPFVQSGKVRPIAALSAKRNRILPDIPTFTEAGYPAMVVSLWFGLMAPAGTPKPVVDRLNAALDKVLEMPAVRKKLEASGANIIAGTPDEFEAYIHDDYVRWGKVIQEARIPTGN